MQLDLRVVRLPAPVGACPAWLSKDRLVDWIGGGGTVHQLDGTVIDRNWRFSYRFDATLLAPSGVPAIIYERFGTKGVVIDDRGTTDWPVIREIDRSYYFADQYEYPLAIFTLHDDRDALVHCPRGYNHLDIDIVTTGECLTERSRNVGHAVDFFHSRLAVNPAGTLLLSAGWCWQPFDSVMVFDINAALRDPATLDGAGIPLGVEAWPWEVNSACFLDDRRVAIASSSLSDKENENVIGTWDIDAGKIDPIVPLEAPVGTMMPVDDTHIMGFFDHPKLVSMETGREVQAWKELSLGPSMHQLSSLRGLTRRGGTTTRVTLDPAGGGFAFFDPTREAIVAARWD